MVKGADVKASIKECYVSRNESLICAVIKIGGTARSLYRAISREQHELVIKRQSHSPMIEQDNIKLLVSQDVLPTKAGCLIDITSLWELLE